MHTKLKFNFVSEKARDTDPKEPNHNLSMFSWRVVILRALQHLRCLHRVFLIYILHEYHE